jgi:hypothetical protein
LSSRILARPSATIHSSPTTERVFGHYEKIPQPLKKPPRRHRLGSLQSDNTGWLSGRETKGMPPARPCFFNYHKREPPNHT